MVPIDITTPRTLGAASGAVALLLLGYGAWRLRIAVELHRCDPTPVATVPNDTGTVAVEGVAEADTGTVDAPFSGAETLLCEWELQERRGGIGDANAENNWHPVDSGLRGGPFRVRDDTGSLRVEPAGSTRHLDEQCVTVPAGVTPPDRIREFLAADPGVDPRTDSLELGAAGPSLDSDLRFVERRVDPGETCYVYGPARRDVTAGSEAGEVNAVIGYERREPFVLADGPATTAVRALATPGLWAVCFGALFLVIAVFGLVG